MALSENDLEEIQRWNSRGDYSGRPGELKRDLDLLVAEVRRLRIISTTLLAAAKAALATQISNSAEGQLRSAIEEALAESEPR